MSWFLAKIVFQIDINRGEHCTQFDESVRLVHAQSLSDAFHKARSFGKRDEDRFDNVHGQSVHWKFIDVSDVYELEALESGVEITSLTHEEDQASFYIETVQQRARMIQQKHFLLS